MVARAIVVGGRSSLGRDCRLSRFSLARRRNTRRRLGTFEPLSTSRIATRDALPAVTQEAGPTSRETLRIICGYRGRIIGCGGGGGRACWCLAASGSRGLFARCDDRGQSQYRYRLCRLRRANQQQTNCEYPEAYDSSSDHAGQYSSPSESLRGPLRIALRRGFGHGARRAVFWRFVLDRLVADDRFGCPLGEWGQ